MGGHPPLLELMTGERNPPPGEAPPSPRGRGEGGGEGTPHPAKRHPPPADGEREGERKPPHPAPPPKRHPSPAPPRTRRGEREQMPTHRVKKKPPASMPYAGGDFIGDSTLLRGAFPLTRPHIAATDIRPRTLRQSKATACRRDRSRRTRLLATTARHTPTVFRTGHEPQTDRPFRFGGRPSLVIASRSGPCADPGVTQIA